MPKGKGKKTVEAVMHDYAAGMLHSGSGGTVTSRRQAIAIGLHESGMARKKKRKKRA